MSTEFLLWVHGVIAFVQRNLKDVISITLAIPNSNVFCHDNGEISKDVTEAGMLTNQFLGRYKIKIRNGKIVF